MPIILASTSSARKALLSAAGIAFEAVAPGVDETVGPDVSPRRAARLLAVRKAKAVSERFPDALVIGSDQTADFQGGLLRKPESRDEARRQLTAMAGRVHRLHTALAVRRQKPLFERTAVVSVKLTLRKLTRKEIAAYLDTSEWEGCAGGYRIEAQGIKLFEAVEGDYHAIIGLPMLRLIGFLREARVGLFG